MWLLKSEYIQFYYYKRIYRKRILSSKPIVCNNDSEFEVHILTSEKDFLDAIWCLKTFCHYSEVRPKLVIHEDGTLSIGNIKTFLKHFVNCRVIRRKDADEDLKHFLANYKYSQKNRLNKDFFCALKLFDAFYYAETDKLLLLDSDILFFKEPNEIIEYIKEGKPFFNSDYQNAYSKPVSELNMRFMAKFNWSSSYSPVKNKEFVRKKSGLKVASRQEYEQIFNKVYLMPCLQFWFEPQINWDGKLLGCCVNTWGDFGNVFESGLKKCLKSEKYVYIKKALLGKKRDRKDIPCIHCGNWEKIRSRPRHKKMQTLMIPLGLAEVNFLKLIIKNLKGRIRSVKSAIETKE